MRPTRTTLLLAAALGIAAGPAIAQVQQGNPNAANQGLSTAGQARATQQNQTTQGNMNQMNLERGQTAAPPPSGGQVMGRPATPGIR